MSYIKLRALQKLSKIKHIDLMVTNMKYLIDLKFCIQNKHNKISLFSGEINEL